MWCWFVPGKAMSQRNLTKKNVFANKEKTSSSGSSSMEIFILILYNKFILGTKH